MRIAEGGGACAEAEGRIFNHGIVNIPEGWLDLDMEAGSAAPGSSGGARHDRDHHATTTMTVADHLAARRGAAGRASGWGVVRVVQSQ